MAYSPSGTAPLPFHHGKATLGPRNTLSSSKLNRLHVKRVGVLFRQIHICRGFSHFSSHATVTQCCSQENWSLLWRDNSSSAGWRCRQRSLSFCLLCSCLWDKGTLCSVETLHWHLNYWRLECSPSHDCCGNRNFRSSELQSTRHTQSLHVWKATPLTQ